VKLGIKLNPLRWLLIIVVFTLATVAVAYLVSGESMLFIIRYVIGFIFVAFLPGYCLVNVLFVKGDRLDLIEELVLSVALSFGLAGISGLFLGLSPIGIFPSTVTVTLSTLTLVLAVIAYIRKIRVLREPNVQSPQKISS
jgi:uncharacterized membrane protein